MLTSFINSNVPKIVESKCKQPLQQLMSIDAKPSHELQTKIFIEQVKKQLELKIKEINNNELHRNNPFNKDQIPRLYSNNNLSKNYESEQNYSGVEICDCQYECEHAQYDYESPNESYLINKESKNKESKNKESKNKESRIEESYLINEYTWPPSGYEIEEDCSKNDSADISYYEYTSFMDRVKEIQSKLTRT